MKEVNKIYCGDSVQLLPQLELKPNLIIMSPPDLSETSFTLEQYIEFIKNIYISAANSLADGGCLISITTDRKIKGSIYLKHTTITDVLKDRLNLFNYKILAKSLKANLYVLTYSHILMFCKGKRPAIKNKLLEFYPDVWLLEQDKVDNYPTKDTFPTELIRRLILTFTNPNDLILDPFIGSGKTGHIALKYNRNFIGFEIEEKFVNLANKYIFNKI